jgi:hypothetical protein
MMPWQNVRPGHVWVAIDDKYMISPFTLIVHDFKISRCHSCAEQIVVSIEDSIQPTLCHCAYSSRSEYCFRIQLVRVGPSNDLLFYAGLTQ